MLVGLLIEHINKHYRLHKMRRVKNPSCRRCGVEKEMLKHILCEWPGVGKDKDADLGLGQDGFGSNKRDENEQYCGLWYRGWTDE